MRCIPQNRLSCEETFSGTSPASEQASPGWRSENVYFRVDNDKKSFQQIAISLTKSWRDADESWSVWKWEWESEHLNTSTIFAQDCPKVCRGLVCVFLLRLDSGPTHSWDNPHNVLVFGELHAHPTLHRPVWRGQYGSYPQQKGINLGVFVRVLSHSIDAWVCVQLPYTGLTTPLMRVPYLYHMFALLRPSRLICVFVSICILSIDIFCATWCLWDWWFHSWGSSTFTHHLRSFDLLDFCLLFFDIYLLLAFVTCSSAWHAFPLDDITHDNLLFICIHLLLHLQSLYLSCFMTWVS